VRIAVLTIGSRGDVEPFAALAGALASAGHHVCLGAAPNFQGLADERRLAFRPLGLDTRALMAEAQTRRIIGAGNPLGAFRGGALRRLRERQTRISQDAWQIAQDMDAIVYKSGLAAGSTVAEKLAIPAIAIALQPMAATRAFPPPLSGLTRDAGARGNRWLGRAFEALVWSIGREGVTALRRELALTPLPYFGARAADEPTTLHAYSPLVVPRPDDWPPHYHVTGFLAARATAGWTPPPDLVRFLAAGAPPIYVGFGSMTHRDPAQLLEVITSALRRAGQRGVVLGGWDELGRGAAVADTIYSITEAPHDWLFPRMAAVVHHGGAGTTAAALRAGVPSLVIPHNFDQPFWGHRVHVLGVAVAPIPLRKLTSVRLAAAFEQLVGDPALRRRAAELGRRMATDDGLGQAVARIHAIIAEHPRARRASSASV
jgi:sterol 3beta-glucosyltransferase